MKSFEFRIYTRQTHSAAQEPTARARARATATARHQKKIPQVAATKQSLRINFRNMFDNIKNAKQGCSSCRGTF